MGVDLAQAALFEIVGGTPQFEALVAIAHRRLCLERGLPTAAADESIGRLAARIEASAELSEDPTLRAFSRLAGTLVDGGGGRDAQAWEHLAALAPALLKQATQPAVEARLERFDRAVDRYRRGELAFADIPGEAGLGREAHEEFARISGATPAQEAPAPGATAHGKEGEGWELRALRGTLSPDEAVRLADLDPASDERTRLQHRRSIADGGYKAVVALWFALNLRKAAQQTEMSLGVTRQRVEALDATNRALGEVEQAMKAAGWDVPAVQGAENAPDAEIDDPVRRRGGMER